MIDFLPKNVSLVFYGKKSHFFAEKFTKFSEMCRFYEKKSPSGPNRSFKATL